MNKIYFDSNNADVRSLLSNIGFSEGQIDNGYVNTLDCLRSHIDDSVLRALATSQKPPEGATDVEIKDAHGSLIDEEGYLTSTLSSEEARRGLQLIRFYGPRKILGLFRQEGCPHGLEAPDILNNLLGINDNVRLFGTVFPASCPYSVEFPPIQVLGVYYSDSQVPDYVANASEAVVQVIATDKSSGSAVLISEEGDLLTARHVLYDDEGNFCNGSVIKIGDRKVAVSPDYIVSENKELDLLRLRVGDLKGLPHLKLAERPGYGDEVWAIGFPGQTFASAQEKLERLSTLGTVKDYEGSGRNILISNLRAAGGNSGGAAINNRGELVGIVSSIRCVGMDHVISNQPDITEIFIPPSDMIRDIKGNSLTPASAE